jgi:hypothetical protein
MVKKVDRQPGEEPDIAEESLKGLESKIPIDVDRYLAKVVGEETGGSTTPMPDQNMVEELAASAGIEIPDKYSLHTSGMLEQRDCHRWELEVESSEDYEERLD